MPGARAKQVQNQLEHSGHSDSYEKCGHAEGGGPRIPVCETGWGLGVGGR